MANQILNQFKENPRSILCTNFIIDNSNQRDAVFFALSILEDFVKNNWDLAPGDTKNGMKLYVVDKMSKYVNNNDYFRDSNNKPILSKINSVIVQIAKNEWNSSWPTVIADFCQSSRTSMNLCENCINILILLSEEINKFSKNNLTKKTYYELIEKMSTQFEEIYKLCKFLFENSSKINSDLLNNAIKLFGEYIIWFPMEKVFDNDILKMLFEFLKTNHNYTLECFSKLFDYDLEEKFLQQLKTNKEKDPKNDILLLFSNDQYKNCKRTIVQIFDNLIKIMYNDVTKKVNIADKYRQFYNNDPRKLNGFEKLIINFEFCIANFFKRNFNYINSFNFVEGTQAVPEFYMQFDLIIKQGLEYMLQFLDISQETIFKVALDFWYNLTFKIFYMKSPEFEIDQVINKPFENNDYLNYTLESHLYKKIFLEKLSNLRDAIIMKMTKPIEVKITIDENGDVVCDKNKNTEYEEIHNVMKDILVYLTNFDPQATNQKLTDKMHKEVEYNNFNNGTINAQTLNSISWSAGCISGSMSEMDERSFLINIIKDLLGLCEKAHGKGNKAICVSNVMYVTGQYPRFLNAHWKFLRTVTKKLFEFMHEDFEGVRDFSCETFLKISLKCGRQFVILQPNENEPYINDLIRNVKTISEKLEDYHILMFYEAIGNLINFEENLNVKQNLIVSLMQQGQEVYNNILSAAKNNSNTLLDAKCFKALDLFVKTNERVCLATKQCFWLYCNMNFNGFINLCVYYMDKVNEIYTHNNGVYAGYFNTANRTAKTFLKFFITLIKNITDINLLTSNIIPKLGDIVEPYIKAAPQAKNPFVLLVFSEVLDKIKNTDANIMLTIWKNICQPTLDMIKTGFTDFPEFRINFYILLNSIIQNSFESLILSQDVQSIRTIKDSLIWAVRHDVSSIFVNGLETLFDFLKKINTTKNVNGIDFCNDFYKEFYYGILHEIIYVMTDTKHGAGFKIQVQILQLLIQIIDNNFLNENLFDGTNNKNYVSTKLRDELIAGFNNVSKNLIETFILALFNKCNNYHEFKDLIRDFIINTKKFSGNSEALWAEEKQKEINEANRIAEMRRSAVPGLQPIYNQQMQQQVSAGNYIDTQVL